jgi:hypothetical protein
MENHKIKNKDSFQLIYNFLYSLNILGVWGLGFGVWGLGYTSSLEPLIESARKLEKISSSL